MSAEVVPDFISRRVELFDKFKAALDAAPARAEKPITVKANVKGTLSEHEATAFKTTAFDIAKLVLGSSDLKKILVAKVNGELWDLSRPLEADTTIQFYDFDSDEGKEVFWHSSAHVLGQACEFHYCCKLSHGPPTDDGFFYDMRIPESRVVTAEDYPGLTARATKINKEDQRFTRLELTKAQLLEMFADNDMKLHFIKEKVQDDETSTVYRNGDFIDLCTGPHIPKTSLIKAFALVKHSSAYWLGNAANEALQRIYGVSFPSAKEMTEWNKMREEMAKRDHRLLGKQHRLFMFNDLSPGSCFFLPHGTRIYNRLVEFIREKYWENGFDEVVTPNMYSTKLWEISGHLANYRENMFLFDIEEQEFAMKPMNCPGHCMVFDMFPRTHRELPIRMADFGVLHRNEFSGALSGLTRVRRFQQDDAHIFAAPDQVASEISKALGFLHDVYSKLGLEPSLVLSTRPDNFIGDEKVWDAAEAQLTESLNSSKFNWELNPGDGAFYGPKIDIRVRDCWKRSHQCATIQLDFQLPIRFNLTFLKEDGTSERPVMIHRAVLGSVERMIAILTEHFAAKWPFWVSPRQICLIPLTKAQDAAVENLRKRLHDNRFFVDVDDSGDTLNRKIRMATLDHYNFTVVIGRGEVDPEDNTQVKRVTVRTRDSNNGQTSATFDVDDFIAHLHTLNKEKPVLDHLNGLVEIKQAKPAPKAAPAAAAAPAAEAEKPAVEPSVEA
ncbi:threonyl-tRNA synthetase [Fonticula alba]|uniref:Probable threonine--tRNA ligase, cytoplasmic n=1 Tax=Fonticula alba TaxID=691883 RepID=A0A058Z595_FONAL|nr:threonyl-tRNA synthetase [Fonticula alba]KCV68697.1 threonyl-tRNA synthetase [Fonticula alba]|eukprot:XP_009497129.1 threonyl-tRNA synthetase [Fonticula alba]